jgi:hypothetical protein
MVLQSNGYGVTEEQEFEDVHWMALDAAWSPVVLESNALGEVTAMVLQSSGFDITE